MDYKEYRSKYAEDTPRRAPQQISQKNSKPILYAIIALAVMLCIIIAVLVAGAFSRPDYVARSVTVEAGRSSVEASDFLVKISFLTISRTGIKIVSPSFEIPPPMQSTSGWKIFTILATPQAI